MDDKPRLVLVSKRYFPCKNVKVLGVYILFEHMAYNKLLIRFKVLIRLQFGDSANKNTKGAPPNNPPFLIFLL